MTVSEELKCHGIQARPAIGYLSILESLRYCEVGGYYKSPLFPIWVVGSTSHFSVLFGDEVREMKGSVAVCDGFACPVSNSDPLHIFHVAIAMFEREQIRYTT